MAFVSRACAFARISTSCPRPSAIASSRRSAIPSQGRNDGNTGSAPQRRRQHLSRGCGNARVLEYLSSAARRLPAGVAPSLGPDATGVGWVYQYVVHGAQTSLAELRTIQDWYVRYGIAKAEGVAEVASVGGFVKQYSVVIDPRRLQALRIPLAKIREALRTSNMDVGGRTVELAEAEFAVRGRGYIKSLSDLEQIVVKNERGVPVLLKDVARNREFAGVLERGGWPQNETPPEQSQTGGVSRSPVGDILRERAPGRLARAQGGQSRVENWAK
jgi:hypothetical protein